MEHSIRVLLMDDDVRFGGVLQPFLTRQSHHWRATNSAAEALKLLQSEQFDVLLLDLDVPGIPGMEVLRFLRAREEDVVPVVLTRSDRLPLAFEAMKLGAFDCLCKEENWDALLLSLDRAARFARVRRHGRMLERTLRDWQATFDACPDLMAVVDPRQQILRCNQAFARRFGFLPDDLVGRAIDTLLPADRGLGRLIDSKLEQACLGLQSSDVQDDRLASDFNVTLAPVQTALGASSSVLVLAHEITERNRVEMALRESESRFTRMAESIAEVFWLVDARTYQVLYVSPAFEQIWGLPRASVSNLVRMRDSVHPEDLPRLIESQQRQQGEGVIEGHGEFRIVRPDGSIRWLCYRTYPVQDKNLHVWGIAAVTQDITEQKMAEQALQSSETRLRAIVETAVDAIITIDTSGRIESSNPAGARMFGYSLDELIGRNVAMLMPDRYAREHDGYLLTYLRTRNRRIIGIGREVDGRRKDGTIFPIELAVSEVQLPNQTLFVGVIRDITERRHLEEVRKRLLQKILAAQEDERRRLSRELHDGVGQSLLSLHVGLQALEKETKEEDFHRRVRQLTDACVATIEEVREMSQGLRPSVLDDLGLLAALERLTDNYQSRYNLVIDLLLTDAVEKRFDREVETALYRIIQEALTNVVRHARARQVSILLEQVGKELVLLIEDDGQGFDVEETLRGSDAHEHLGLSGMRERAQLLGAELTLESSPGLGTTLRVKIPLGESEHVQDSRRPG